MSNLSVKNVIISKQIEESENLQAFKEIVNKNKIKVSVIDKVPTSFQIETRIHVQFLWPDSSNLIQDNGLNNNSIVCKIYYNNFSILFTGDIERIAEKEILQKYRNNLDVLKAAVLKVAHHGSNTSSTKDFLEAVKPQISLIGVKENNKFGHPNEEVIERLNNIRSKSIKNR